MLGNLQAAVCDFDERQSKWRQGFVPNAAAVRSLKTGRAANDDEADRHGRNGPNRRTMKMSCACS